MVDVVAYLGTRELVLGQFTLSPDAWTRIVARSGHASAMDAAPIRRELGIGTGQVVLADVRTLDRHGNAKGVFAHGEPFVLSMAYRINAPAFREAVQLLVSFHRDGVQDTCRVFCRALLLDAADRSSGSIEMHLPRLPLGAGTYTVSVGITEPGYFDRDQVVFYSINPGMYDCLIRGLEIEVVSGGIVGSGTGIVAEGEWRLAGVGVAT